MKLLDNIKLFNKLRKEMKEDILGAQAEKAGLEVWYFDPTIIPAEPEAILVLFLKRRYQSHVQGLSLQECKDQMLHFHNQSIQGRERGLSYMLIEAPNLGGAISFDESVVMTGDRMIEVKDL